MRPRAFLSEVDHDRIVAAIGEAERLTSGQVRLFISHRRVADPVAAAASHLHHLGLAATGGRNAVLLFVAPLSRTTFAVVGDEGIHARAGAAWEEISQALRGHFQRGAFTDGLLDALARSGRLLAAHYPPVPGQGNGQPDEIETDDGPR